MTKIIRFATMATLICAASSAQAISVYTSQASFLGALGGSPVTTFDFESLSPGDLINNGDTLLDPVNGLDATFSTTAPFPIIVDNFFPTTSGSNYIGADDGSFSFFSGDSVTVSFDSQLQAAGLYVIGAPFANLANDFTLTTDLGDSVSNNGTPDQLLTYATGELAGDAFFLGLIIDNPGEAFTSFTLSSLNIDPEFFQFNIDDISVSPVPVPAAVWLFGSALLGLLGLGRKRTHRS